MTTLTLSDVPDELVTQLEQEAQRNHRSLNQETLARLTESLARRQRSGEETVTALRRLHARLSVAAPLTDELLDRARREGRP